MKYLLRTVLLMFPILLAAQTPQGINYQAVAYDVSGFETANQEISIRLGILLETADTESSYTETHQVSTNDFGLFSLVISEGISTDDFSTLNWGNGAFLKIEMDANLDGNYTLMGINSFSSVPYSIHSLHSLHSNFAENIPTYYSEEIEGLVSEIGGLNNEIDSLKNIVEMVSQYFGCKDHDACNYNTTATISDNSCTYAITGYTCDGECIDTDTDGVCDLDEVEGCTDTTACNYIVGATDGANSCIYQETYHTCQGNCENDDDGDGICDELEQGCADSTADNYNPQALSNSSACIYSGCMDNTSGNYNPQANQDDGSCIPAEACPYPEYLEYDSTAASFNANLCNTIAVYGCMDFLALNYNPAANVNEGCEHIYGCINGMADNYSSDITSDDGTCIISGCMDESSGNYDSFANTDDGNCLIGGCVNVTAENYNPEAGINDGSCIIYGCILANYPNYNYYATIDDNSCDLNSLELYGCTDSLAYNFDSLALINNGICILYQIGELVEGGIVFYIDETGEHGLVAALEDITEGSNMGAYGIPEGFEWGCYGTYVSGADGQDIGTGTQNTLDIVAQNCQTKNGGITAAQATLNYSVEGYTDWYLPSKGELQEMYSTIGNGGSQGNIGGFETNDYPYYWSSSEDNTYGAWLVYSNDSNPYSSNKYNSLRVRCIRAF